MTLDAHAKINLGLHILRKREDEYHDLETVFHRISWHDSITLTPKNSGITLRCNLPYIPTDDRNLCVRAAQLLFETSRYDGGVHIDLDKTVPAGAGLGGGSSNAAAVLLGLNDLFALHAPTEVLHHIGRQLGADIPFFLGSHSAYATGRGDVLEFFHLTLSYTIVVVYPGVHVSTKWAYQHLQLRRQASVRPEQEINETGSLKGLWLEGDLAKIRTLVRNDFESAVFPAFPPVAAAKEKLLELGAEFALMSGSGSSVFGLFSDTDTALRCTDAFPRNHLVSVTPGE